MEITMETNGDNSPLGKPGLYRQKETGAEIQLDTTPGVGTPIIDAFKQAGFVLVTDGPKVAKVTSKTASVTVPTQEQ